MIVRNIKVLQNHLCNFILSSLAEEKSEIRIYLKKTYGIESVDEIEHLLPEVLDSVVTIDDGMPYIINSIEANINFNLKITRTTYGKQVVNSDNAVRRIIAEINSTNGNFENLRFQ
jgi:hypothetical protein